jgi:hypothetical protein
VGGKDYKYYCHIILKKENGMQKDEYVHRMVAEAFVPNPKDKPVVDHWNGDTLDNRVENLRWATRRENSANAKKRKARTVTSGEGLKYGPLTSKYKGVSKQRKGLKKWQVSCGTYSAEEGTGYVGRYETEVEAAEAYNERAKELYGDFAYLNVI